MTTLAKEKATCVVCGREGKYTVIHSTNQLGSSDLDTRPPEMARSTMRHWVTRCKRCGFCASSVATVVPHAPLTMEKPEYRAQLKSPDYPELANSFLCEAMLLDAGGLLLDAARSALCAAWVCDDAALPKQAIKCRLAALSYGAAAFTDGRRPGESEGTTELMLADVARRAGEFAKALEWCDAARAVGVSSIAARVEVYQRHLCSVRDTAVHLVSEAESFEPPN